MRRDGGPFPGPALDACWRARSYLTPSPQPPTADLLGCAALEESSAYLVLT